MKMNEEDLLGFLFIVLGVGYLFPFSALTNPVDYWRYLFPDFNIEFPITACFMWTNLAVLFVIVFLCGKPSYTFRLVGGFIGQLSVLVLVPSSYFLHLNERSNFIVVMVSTAFAAVVTAGIDSCIIAFASLYPKKALDSLQVGIGVSTLIGCIYRILTKLFYPANMVVASSLLYFYVGAATIVICIASFYYLLVLPVSKRSLPWMNHYRGWRALPESETELVPLDGILNVTSNPSLKNCSYGSRDIEDCGKSNELNAGAAGLPPHHQSEPKGKWEILIQTAKFQVLLFVVFTQSLSLWPPLVTEIRSFSMPYLNETSWWPMLLLTLFSVLDVVGRYCIVHRGCLTPDNIWIIVVARFAFVPLIICSATGWYFQNDFLSVLFVGGLGFTNGYIGSLCVVMSTECVAPIDKVHIVSSFLVHFINFFTGVGLQKCKSTAGMFTGFFLNFGLVFGATLGLAIHSTLISS